jgi:hypothetical protein
MKAANILIAGLAAVTLTGCSTYNDARNMIAPQPGHSVEFVSGSTSSVLIDFDNSRPGELKYADAMAKDKCTIFGKSAAALESLNPRGDGDMMRASYLCQ